VEANLGKSIGLADLAALVGVSTRHFIRAFSESTGNTPHQFVIARRIDRAKGMLAKEGHSLTDIALATGFSHSQHFASAFKKHTGLCPSHFRAALQ
jgi:AraC family transcriptional regulator